jgi:hypothetical protein
MGYFKILRDKRVTLSSILIADPQLLGATVWNLVAALDFISLQPFNKVTFSIFCPS